MKITIMVLTLVGIQTALWIDWLIVWLIEIFKYVFGDELAIQWISIVVSFLSGVDIEIGYFLEW